MVRFRNTLLATTALMPLGIVAAVANPLGSQVVGGAANVQGQGTSAVTVTQSTDKAIINWQSFNISAGQTTQFVQPNSSSVTLNRVTGNMGASAIDGTLTANGRVFLVNPDGILFGAGSKINTGSFLATTNDIRNGDFLAGRYQFNIPGRPDASIVNLGSITAQNGGFAALVAPGVRNTGTITATFGTVGLAAGNNFSLDFYGDRLITLGVNNSIAAKVIDVATGKPLNALVQNDGKLKANGGRVELTAAAARQVVDSVINNTGVIEANSIGSKNGMIVLGAATAASKPAGAPPQTIKLSGTISAAGKRKNTKGGTIVVSSENIQLSSAKIDASGQAGGGKVLIGGDVGGGKGNAAVAGNSKAALESFAVATASTVSVDAATTINASAKASGDGGKVVVWSDQATTFFGTIKAQDGAQSGNGGFVETSGHQSLTFNGAVDTSAPRGKSGTLLLDPQDALITTNGGPGIVTVSSIEAALLNGDVVVTTGSAGSDLGNITVAANIGWANANALTLSAYKDIIVNANITNTGGAAVNLRADNTGTGVGTVSFGGGATISTSGAVSIFYNPSVNPAGSIVNTLSYLNPMENFSGNVIGGGKLTAYLLVNSVYDLQNIQNNLSGTYALGKDIDANATAGWNGGAGFVPIGGPYGASWFTGILDGENHVINQLTIANSPGGYVGLIGRLHDGIIENLGVTNAVVSTSGLSAVASVGILVGENTGVINNSYASGTITITDSALEWFAGGLVGQNGYQASINQSHAAVNISANNSTTSFLNYTGGLVGLNVAASSTITQSYATGNITGFGNQNSALGGFVGENAGTIQSSYSTGNATATVVAGGGGSAGGFAGNNINGGTISNSYATGSVGGALVGGLVGNNAGTLTQTYATGFVSGSGVLGGLVGVGSGGTVTSSYWDAYTTGQLYAYGNHTGVGATAVTSDPNQSSATNYAYKQSAYGNLNFATDWFMIDGLTRLFGQWEYSTTITNAHQLQLMAMNFGASYTLANNIDLGPELANVLGKYPGLWGSSGFAPIGSSATPFAGTFDGQGHTIDNLFINSAATYVGLFGYVGSAGVVSNVGLRNAAVSGGVAYSVGGLAGLNSGTISQSYVGGAVAGGINGNVGGLVGTNSGLISQSYATASIAGSDSGNVGGLVGKNNGTITQSYAVGPVDSSGTLTLASSVGTTSDGVYSTYIAGNYAYVASANGGLLILDISNPKNPVQVGSYTTGPNLSVRNVVVAGNYAYIDNGGNVSILDVSNCASPALVANYPIGSAPYAVGLAISGNYLFATDINNHALRVLDISNPAAPTLAGSYNGGINSFPYSIAVSGKFAYIGDGAGSVYALDVSNPANPIRIGLSYDPKVPGSAPLALSVSGNNLYVTDQLNLGLYILNIANPAAPTLVGSYNSGGLNSGGGNGDRYYGVSVVGDHVFVAGDYGLRELNVSIPAAPTLVGSYAVGPRLTSPSVAVTLSGKYSYLSSLTNGLQVLDVTASNNFVGGLVGRNGSAGIVTSSYWDTQATGQNASAGGTGQTTAQLKSALPTGFDPTVWASSPNVNSGYPNLLWQFVGSTSRTTTTLRPAPGSPPNPMPGPNPTPTPNPKPAPSPSPTPPPNQIPINLFNLAPSNNAYFKNLTQPGTQALNSPVTSPGSTGWLMGLLAKFPGIDQATEYVVVTLLTNAVNDAVQKTLLSPTQTQALWTTFAKNLESENSIEKATGLSFFESVATHALGKALQAEMRQAGYSEYLTQPTVFVMTLAMNSGFAALDPTNVKLGGPEVAAVYSAIQTTSGQLVQVAQQGVGLWNDVNSLKENFETLNANMNQLYTLAKQQQSLGNLAQSSRLLELASSTQTTINNLRKEYTVGGVSILETSGWNLLSIFAN